jgi:hypothetical protein
MKIVAVEQGRVLDLVPIEEIRPEGGIYLPALVNGLLQRYGFISGPKDLTEVATAGAKFLHGHFPVNGEDVVVRELGFYSDGMIVDCHNTTFADAILDDFFKWAGETFKLRERQTPAQRTYTSVIVFDFDKAIEPILGKLLGITGMLSESLRAAYGWEYEYGLQRLAYQVDPTAVKLLRNTLFFIERRLNVAFSENRYYSGAPLRTEQHMALLAAIEQELFA